MCVHEIKVHPEKIIMGKILVVGSSNTDMVVKTERFPHAGETVLGGDFYMFPGGKGANQAVAAARLGGEVTFMGKVGDDVFGQGALQGLRAEKINTSLVSTLSGCSSGVALITVDKNGQNQIVVAPGTNAQLTKEDLIPVIDRMEEYDVVLCQLEIPMDTVEHLIVAGKEAGTKVILNPAPANALQSEILDGLFLIVPNESEVEVLTGINITSVEEAKKGGDLLLSYGVQNVIITLGARGSLFLSKDEFFIQEARIVDVVDTTAAGDVYCGALAVMLAEGKSWSEAMRFATYAASMAITKMGAQTSAPFLAEVIAQLQ